MLRTSEFKKARKRFEALCVELDEAADDKERHAILRKMAKAIRHMDALVPLEFPN